MKKRRSVTKLSEKDTQKASKYVLTHQELDSDGDLATKYVKVRWRQVFKNSLIFL